MNILPIEESKNKNIFKRFFKPLEMKNNRLIINTNFNKIGLKKKIKLVKKIKRLIDNNNFNKVIICKNLRKNGIFINLLYSNNIDIIDGKKIFKMYILDIVDYIIKNQNFKKAECKIAIVTNEYNIFIEKVIKNLSENFKNIQVISEKIDHFKRLEEALYNDGIIITVTNNKRKALLNSNIILNMNFAEEILNLYNIYDKATIVNFEDIVRIKKKRFSGNIINWYNLRANKDSDVLNLIKSENMEIYDFNELVEYLYDLDKINLREIFLKNLVSSSGRIM